MAAGYTFVAILKNGRATNLNKVLAVIFDVGISRMGGSSDDDPVHMSSLARACQTRILLKDFR